MIRDVAEVQPTVVDEGMLSWFAKDLDPEVRETIAQVAERVEWQPRLAGELLDHLAVADEQGRRVTARDPRALS